MRVRDPLTSFATFSGVALTTIYFVQKQKLEEMKLFKDLFTEFNTRYERQNGKLADIKANKINGSDDTIKYSTIILIYVPRSIYFIKRGASIMRRGVLGAVE
jgi:hypothetical protein